MRLRPLDPTMNVYRPSTPYVAATVVAAAMAAITIATMVVLPAELEAAAVKVDAANAVAREIVRSPGIAAAASAQPEPVERSMRAVQWTAAACDRGRKPDAAVRKCS